MQPLRVIVCGSRDAGPKDKDKIYAALDAELNPEGAAALSDLTIIHGGADGVDKFADTWARKNYARVEEYEADWLKYDKAAGPIRNQRMIDEGKPDLVLAFPGGTGTVDMVRRAKKAGILVKQLGPDGRFA